MHNWLRCLRSGAHLGAISPQPPAGPPPQPPAGPPAAPPVPPRGGPRGGWAWVVAMCPLLTPLQDPGVTSSPPLRRDRAGGPCLPRLHVTAGWLVHRDRTRRAGVRSGLLCSPPSELLARPARGAVFSLARHGFADSPHDAAPPRLADLIQSSVAPESKCRARGFPV